MAELQRLCFIFEAAVAQLESVRGDGTHGASA
jgi:hypothetical protein